MMAEPKSDLDRAKNGMAILSACIVQTMNDADPTFRDRFLERLSHAYSDLRNKAAGNVVEELELLSWTRELLTGFSIVSGQGKPFQKD